MLKKVLRAAARKARRWLEEDQPQREKTEISPEQTVYPLAVAWCSEILKHDPERPNYAWGVAHAAALARALQVPHISVIELGVAGGKGLVALEKIAQKAGEICRLEIDVYGFDTGVGLPKPTDYRDLPNLFSEGFFPMDAEKLRKRLEKAKLTLGLVEDTIPKFINSKPSPIGFIAFDLDLYTSTKHALRLFEADERLLLPRVYCYFDDILGSTHSEFTGELLAISEFNVSHAMRKISKINGLRYLVPTVCHPNCWVEQFYMAHIFEHKLYGHYDDSNPRTTLDLS
jgi:hypothetical protein